MSAIIGEAWVKIRPLIGGFAGELEAEGAAAAREAGALTGREYSRAFGRSANLGTQVKRELGDAERGAAASALSFRGLGRAVAYASGTFLAVGGLVEGIKKSVEA